MSIFPTLLCPFFMLRFWGVLALLVAGMLSLSTYAHGQAPSFSGRYDGLGIGADAVLSLEELEGRVVGRLTLKDNQSFSLNGRRSGDVAQGSLMRNALKQFFYIEPRALGVQLLIIPAGEDGTPLLAKGQELSFIRQGVQLPKPVSFQKAPTSSPLALPRFLDEFRNWSPQDLARVYVGLEVKDQALISLFDYASAEILWRICVSTPPHEDLSAAQLNRLLTRQATDCRAYLKVIAKVRDSGQIDLFIRRANFQFELIRKTYECNRAQKSKSMCHEVNALSAPLISEWRPAIAIMEGLVTPHPATGIAEVSGVNGASGVTEHTPLSKPRVISKRVPSHVPSPAVVQDKGEVVRGLRSTLETFAPLPQERPTFVEVADVVAQGASSVRLPMPRPHR